MAHRYQDDLALLRDHTDVIELTLGPARVAIAPNYQGRIMTSTLAGGDGQSFGWLNRDHIASDTVDRRFNNFGGEDRLWLGPEAGQFGLWFRRGEPFDTEHWRTPEGFNEGSFNLESRSDHSVHMTKVFTVVNAIGTAFDCAIRREVNLLEPAQLARSLAVEMPEGLSAVGFESVNVLTNAGHDAWTRRHGLLSVWIVGQFIPLSAGRIVVPFRPGPDSTMGPRATTDYFGPVPAERLTVADDHLRLTGDGRYRCKLGISPHRARDVLGSYDAQAGTLTLVQFSLPDDAGRRPYVNSLWKIQDDPFAGDVVNVYNDGEEVPGEGQLGPFYELETSSPAADLNPGGRLIHTHRTMHFAGDVDKLDALARAVLGVGVTDPA